VPRIAVPADEDPLVHLWTTKTTGLTARAGAFSAAVYERSTLPIREFEAARITIARVNDCELCLGYRAAAELPGRAADADLDERFYDAVLGDRIGLTAREALAAEFAERFALDHRNMDDELWGRLHASFTDDELVELGLCVGAWLAFGRLNRVFDVDGGCRVSFP
jgi:alkylhydroperoxidase family enzyme